MSTNTPPRPERTRVFLMTAGSRKPTPTLHHYLETKAARTRKGEPIWEHLFKCFKTGAIRRYGFDDRVPDHTAPDNTPSSPEVN